VANRAYTREDKMTQYVVPNDLEFISEIAKSIARERMIKESTLRIVEKGISVENVEQMENAMEKVFERLWSSPEEINMHQRKSYIDDARVAINAINLKLILLET
jgi:hypothetical protein